MAQPDNDVRSIYDHLKNKLVKTLQTLSKPSNPDIDVSEFSRVTATPEFVRVGLVNVLCTNPLLNTEIQRITPGAYLEHTGEGGTTRTFIVVPRTPARSVDDRAWPRPMFYRPNDGCSDYQRESASFKVPAMCLFVLSLVLFIAYVYTSPQQWQALLVYAWQVLVALLPEHLRPQHQQGRTRYTSFP